LYRDCKALCEERNRPLVSFARYRKIFNCEIYVEFFNQNNDRCHVFEYHKTYHKNVLINKKTGKKMISIPIMMKHINRKEQENDN